MKKIVTVTEVNGEGLEALLGELVLIFCMNYFYYGKLIGVNETCILLEKAHIIYETGAFNDKSFKDKQFIAEEWYVQKDTIESFGKSPKS